MTQASKRLFTDETAQEILKSNEERNALLRVLARESLSELPTSYSDIQRIVRSGAGPYIFTPGDKIYTKWVDKDNNDKEYTVPWDILGFRDVELPDGEIVPAMGIKWHYGTPYNMPLDAQEAFYVAASGLAAGTYNITVGANWGNNCVSGKKYQFTLTQDVPKNGLLVGFYAMPDRAPSQWTVSSYTARDNLTAIETVSVAEGSGGVSLGTFIPAGDGVLNSLHRLAYGNGRWGQSFLRQWLNSSGTGFWTPQNDFDMIPAATYSGKHGFMGGFDDEFLSCIGPTKIRTALNTVNESSEGTYEDLFDTFFLLSLEESYITPQLSGAEGETFEYSKRASGRTTPIPWYTTGAAPILTGIENATATRYNRLRSASLGNASYTWYVYPSGYVSASYAVYAYRCAPACFIY